MNKEYDNTVIEVLDLAHGQKVKEFWLRQGVNVPSDTGFICTKEGNYKNRYYGVINGLFECYSLMYVQSHGAKIITLPPSKMKYDNTVIEVLDVAHGQEVKKFWIGQGVDAAKNFNFNCAKTNSSDQNFFYGLINGKFNNHRLDQVQKHGARIIELPPSEIKYEFQDGDMVKCIDSNQAHTLLTLAGTLGYQINLSYPADSLIYSTNNGFYCTGKGYPHGREISQDDFVALITGRLPKYWCFEKLPKYWCSDIEEKDVNLALNYLNKIYGTSFTGISKYYGYDGSLEEEGSMTCPNSLNKFKNNPFLLSVPYILQAIEKEKEHRTKFDNLPKSIKPMQKINRNNVKEIYNNVTCAEFRRRITEKLNEFPFDTEIPVSDGEILEMFKATVQSPNLTNILSKFFKKPECKKNVITKYPTIDGDFFCINHKVAGNLFTENKSITKQTYDGHYPNIYLENSYGTWRDENGNPISGYLYFIPKS